MTKTSNIPTDPLERLAAITRQFGEYGGVNTSIETSATFTVLKADTLPEIFAGKLGPDDGTGCYLYGRCFNPTTRTLGRQIAALEGAEAGYCTASGLSAITATLLALCNTGDHILASDTIYGGTHALLHDFFPKKFNITSTQLPVDELERWEAAITPRTRVVYVESVSNPTLKVADIPALAALAHAHGLTLVVDNTFAPLIISPLAWGADVVVHSVTKFISGAADIVAGAIVGREEFITSLMDPASGPLMLLGPTMDPKVAAELILRLPHLGLRLREHGARAELFAARLEALGAAVRHPGLPSHPQHELFKRLANPGYGSGGMLTIDLRTPTRAGAFLERLQNKHAFGLLAVSLGYFDTLMSASAGSTSSELSDADLDAAGISRGLVRMSVGITGGVEARWAALEEAYKAVASVPAHVVKPPYKAAQVRKDAVTGATLQRTPSWHSFGSDDEAEDEGEVHAEETALSQKKKQREGPWVRRIDTTTHVEYTPVV